jgi:hypothetical protein
MPFNLPRITKILLIANIVGFALQWLLGDARMQVFELWPLGDSLYDPFRFRAIVHAVAAADLRVPARRRTSATWRSTCWRW